MRENGYYEDVIPEPFTILGVRLRPLSLGHILLLTRIGSPFFSDDEEKRMTLGDIATAVFFCSLTYSEGLSALDDTSTQGKLYDWSQSLSGQSGFWGWLPWRYKPVNVAEKAELFKQYLEAGLRQPMFVMDSDRETVAVDIPMVQAVKIALMCKTTLTETEILDRPWTVSIWDYLSMKAMEGNLKLVDEEKYKEAAAEADRIHKLICQA